MRRVSSCDTISISPSCVLVCQKLSFALQEANRNEAFRLCVLNWPDILVVKQNSDLQSNALVVPDEQRISVFYINPLRCVCMHVSLCFFMISQKN